MRGLPFWHGIIGVVGQLGDTVSKLPSNELTGSISVITTRCASYSLALKMVKS